LKRYDVIDQAQILNATCWVNSRTNGLTAMGVEKMLRALRELPGAITEQWKRMGILEF
jgi:hypothetical protein